MSVPLSSVPTVSGGCAGGCTALWQLLGELGGVAWGSRDLGLPLPLPSPSLNSRTCSQPSPVILGFSASEVSP